MTKKKKKNGTEPVQPMSPERYIRERARLLPIDRCMVNADWKEAGDAEIMVVRRHSIGNYTVGMFLVDTFCRGVYDTLYWFNLSKDRLDRVLNSFKSSFEEIEDVDYTVVHNIIFGAVEFADEAGIEPCEDFNLTQYILEEDTDDVPLIEYEFGRNGKHWLFAQSEYEANKYLPAMIENLGDNYEVTIDDSHDSDYDDEEDDYDEGYDEASQDFSRAGEYSYVHPEYPSQIELKHQWLRDMLTTPDKEILTKKDIDRLLALPHDELRHDLEQMALYEMGRNASGEYSEKYNPVIGHVLILLGEVGDEGSLDVMLEIMRQDEKFFDYHIDACSKYLILQPLRQLAKNNLHRLLDYLKEPGLYTYFRIDVAEVMICSDESFKPERRTEILGYAHELIEFLIDKKDDPKYMDSTLASFLCWYLVDLEATELLPDIEALFAAGFVEVGICGTLDSIKKDIRKPQHIEKSEPYNVYEIYKDIKRTFGN